MKKILERIIILCVATTFIFALPQYNLKAKAEEEWKPEYTVTASPNCLRPGVKTKITVEINNYESGDALAITGIQIDLSGIDFSSVEISDIASCVSDNAAYNSANYIKSKNIVRFLYYNMNGTLDKKQKQLFYFYITPNTSFTSEAKQLDVKCLTTTKSGKRSSETVNFNFGDEEPSQDDVIDVDIEIGEMSFSYYDGIWNPESHEYSEGEWIWNKGANEISVSSNKEVTVELLYTPKEEYGVGGKFTYNNKEITELKCSESAKTIYFIPINEPKNIKNSETEVGTIFIRIQGGNDEN